MDMALNNNSLIEIALDMRWQGQQNLNVWAYQITSWVVGVNAVQVAEAWWNHVKVTYRLMQVASEPDTFLSARIREMNNVAGDYAEFAIPSAERVGTRANPGAQGVMPPYVAIGARLVVGTRVTRSGQKRYSFSREEDVTLGFISAAWKTVIANNLAVMTAGIVLGAPAATVTLSPRIFRKDFSGSVTAHQPITGYIVNDAATTQNTRKFGRGS